MDRVRSDISFSSDFFYVTDRPFVPSLWAISENRAMRFA